MKYLEQNITKQALNSLPPKLKRIGMLLASPGYLEGTEPINCSRRADYDLLLAQFNTYRDALLLQNATKAEKDAAQKVRRDRQHQDFFAVQATLQDAVSRGEAAREAAEMALGKFQTYSEQATLQQAAVDSECKGEPSPALRTLYRKRMQAVTELQALLVRLTAELQRGHQEDYESTLSAALSAVHGMNLPAPQARILEAEVASKTSPSSSAAHLLAAVYREAEERRDGAVRRCTEARAALAAAEDERARWQEEVATVSGDAERQADVVRQAESKIHGLEGADLAATVAAEAAHVDYEILRARIDEEVAALQEVTTRLEAGLAVCASP